MAVTRKIGLSLGADLCWPICFEDILNDLKPSVRVGGEEIRFQVDRVTIEPFDLNQPTRYDIVLDRLTHWYHTSREWIKKAVIMDRLYVLNNPWSVQSMEKQTSYCAMMKLGLPIPTTWLLPPKEYEDTPDLQPTLERYAKLFDLDEIGRKIGFPFFMKPYDGGGWVGVTKIDNESDLQQAYDKSGKFVMHLQKGILPYEEFVRCVGVGPQVLTVRYDPAAPLHARYTDAVDFLSADQLSELRKITLTINSFFGWDFNSCESLLQDGIWAPIDFANPCPDSQVTSLNFHFPWLVKAKLRWALFVAATKKSMRVNLDWQPYFEIADRGLPYEERLNAYAAIADRRFETERFLDFCDTQLSALDEAVWHYFADERAQKAIRSKVESLFPEHEWDQFTDYFWDKIQKWREYDAASRAASFPG
ncbi:MAG: hypothetical protein DWQ01_04670 [Planctomycetota bacterium]|nr:MAG: hypothetical protein DWQ01_04670 [Planctomycetota bacterium]